MKTSPAGLQFIADWEGLRLSAYRDSGGLLTIGIGHLLTDHERQTGALILDHQVIPWRPKITQDQALQLLRQDIETPEQCLQDCNTRLAQHQFDALTSFIFNVGANAFLNSTLRRHLIAKAWDNIPLQLKLWCNVNGKPVEGLHRRRTAESLLFTQGRYSRP